MVGVRVLMILLLLSISAVFGQQTIDRNEYYKTLRAASAMSSKVARRVSSTAVTYGKGTAVRTESVRTEFVPPDRRHEIKEIDENGTKSRFESIVIGRTLYCRSSDGTWAEGGSCVRGEGNGGPSNIISADFRKSRERRDGIQFVRIESLWKFNRKVEDRFIAAYSWEKTLIDDQGRIVHRETESGLLEPKSVERSETEKYEYPSDLTIAAPDLSALFRIPSETRIAIDFGLLPTVY